MKRALVAVCCLLASSPAMAQFQNLGPVVPDPAFSPTLPVLPPANLDRKYSGIVLLSRLNSREDVHTACHSNRSGLGCSYAEHPWPGVCMIIIVSDKALKESGWSFDIVYRHEQAHCNGWTKDHPGSRTVQEVYDRLPGRP
jgi:hypothetical protein